LVRKASSSRGVKVPNLAKLDHLALTIAAPEMLGIGLLWGRSAKSSVEVYSVFSLASQNTSAKLRFPRAISLLLNLTWLCRLVLLQGSPLALQHAVQ